MTAHSPRAQLALARLPEIDPAIAALALWCSFRDSDGPTMTQGDTILIGPGFARLPISEQTGLIAHHVLHVALRHSARRAAARLRFGPRFHETLYDLACDAMVNEALLQGGHALPRPAVRASELVARLPQDQRPDAVLTDWDSDRLYAALAELDAPDGSDGEATRYARAQSFVPDLQDGAPDTTEAEIWAGRTLQALQAGQRAGSGIGAVLARFGDLPQTTVPWEIRLSRLLNKALFQHPAQSHRSPARAWLARDALARHAGGPSPVFEPGTLRQQRRPRLVIAVDTSSSIGDTVLDMFMAEALSAARRSGAETHLLGFDTEVHSARRMIGTSVKALPLRRDGGTDFAPALAASEMLDPSLTLILTDLDAPVPPSTLRPLIWAVPTAPREAPPYGEVLTLDDPYQQQNPPSTSRSTPVQ